MSDADQYRQFCEEHLRTTSDSWQPMSDEKRNRLGATPRGECRGMAQTCSRDNSAAVYAGLRDMDTGLEPWDKISAEDFFRSTHGQAAVLWARQKGKTLPMERMDAIFKFLHDKEREDPTRSCSFIQKWAEGEDKSEPFDTSFLTTPMPKKKAGSYGTVMSFVLSDLNLNRAKFEGKNYKSDSVDLRKPPLYERLFSPEIWADKLDEMIHLWMEVEASSYAEFGRSEDKLPMDFSSICDQVIALSKEGEEVARVLKSYRKVTIEDLTTRKRYEEGKLISDEEGRAPLEYKAVWDNLSEILKKVDSKTQPFTRELMVERQFGRHYRSTHPQFEGHYDTNEGGSLLMKAAEMGHIDTAFSLINRSRKLTERVEKKDLLEPLPGESEAIAQVLIRRQELPRLFSAQNWQLNPEVPMELYTQLPSKYVKDDKNITNPADQRKHVSNLNAVFGLTASDAMPGGKR